MHRLRLTAFVTFILTAATMTLTPTAAPADGDYAAVIARQEASVLRFLRAFETVQEALHPAHFTQLQGALTRAFAEDFGRLRSELEPLAPPAGRETFHQSWMKAVGLLEATYRVFTRSDPSGFFGVFVQTRDAFARARFTLYDIRDQTPTLSAYWVADDAREELAAPENNAHADPEVGILHYPASGARAAYSLYVPEYYAPGRKWPLIVALHGGSGANDEYLLTWLRPAKSRGYFILSPKSVGSTWGIEKPDADTASIASMLESVAARYAIDAERILLSGLSDGGTFSYALATSRPDLFAAVAPVAGVLPGWLDVGKASALPFLIVHGGQDFIFPVATARRAHATLVEHGFEAVTYEELPDWGHAYTYSINAGRILPWFEALPQD